ncbi:hypothetical protein JQC67_08695 [Aurantibacter crassamenti]|uniref:hypothetical protein n=1 Tax=Aurantibacter crassamenti TaxID=1837375 RepID=UPI001939348C|nr:hypothetical protein [Aurantibacter crassamenti]MBM1106211.1 hypothetical protein [Aurantibacter crassamenti]
MAKNLLLCLLISIPILTSGQVRKLNEQGSGLINLERHQFKLNLVGPGISYELGLFKNVTASTSFGPSLAYYTEGYSFGFAWHTRLRYYHNLTRRIDMRKNVSGNSGNYISAARSVFWAPLQISNNLQGADDFAMAFYGGVYGIQRTYEKGFNFNIELGAGYYRGDGVLDGYGTLLNFSFGWVPTKRKSRKPTFD